MICGHVHSGTLSPGEELQFVLNGQVVKAHTVESWFKRKELVIDGDQVGIAIRGLQKVRGMPRLGDVKFNKCNCLFAQNKINRLMNKGLAVKAYEF